MTSEAPEVSAGSGAARPGAPDAARPEPAAGGAVGGVIWTTGQRWVVRLTGLATVMLLTRLLGPEQFGLVAVAMALTPAVYLISDLGFSTYLVQVPQLDRRSTATAFFYSAASGLVLVGLFAAAAPALAALFGAPGAAAVVWGMTPGILATALASVPTALLKRRMEFRRLAIQGAIGSLAGQVLAIALALAGAGVWALIAQLLAFQVIGAALAWSSARWRPAAAFDVAEFRRMFAFGLSVVGSDGVALLRQWAETAVIGAVLGVTGLGYLNVAQRLVAVASDLSASAIVPVSTVVFARIRATADELRRTYLRALSTSYAVVMPFLVFVTVGAGDIMRILFGAGWGPSVVPAQALSIAGILTLGAALDSGLFYGTGRPGRWFAYATAVDAATVAATAIGVRWGLVGTSLGFVAVALAATIARWFLVGRHLGAPAARVARPILSTAVAGAASGGAGLLVGAALAGASAWPRLCAVGCVVVLVHLAVLRVSAPATFLDVRRMLGGRADRVRSRLRTARRTVSDAIPDPRDGAVPTRR